MIEDTEHGCTNFLELGDYIVILQLQKNKQNHKITRKNLYFQLLLENWKMCLCVTKTANCLARPDVTTCVSYLQQEVLVRNVEQATSIQKGFSKGVKRSGDTSLYVLPTSRILLTLESIMAE